MQMILVRRCGMSGFKSSSSDWKHKAAADAHTLSEYIALFGSDEAAPSTAPSAAAADQGDGDKASKPDAAVGLDATSVAGQRPSRGNDVNGGGHGAQASNKRKKRNAAEVAEKETRDIEAEELQKPKAGKKLKKAKKLSTQQQQQQTEGEVGLLEVLEDIPSKPSDDNLFEAKPVQVGKKSKTKRKHLTNEEVQGKVPSKPADSNFDETVSAQQIKMKKGDKAASKKAAKAKIQKL